MGADHQIKEGSYVTTIKIRLMVPGVDILATKDAAPAKIGGDPGAAPLCTSAQPVGTFACAEDTGTGNVYPLGWGDATDGTGVFCDPAMCA